MKAIDLKFKKFTDPRTPPFTCNACGKRYPGLDRYYSEIHFAEGAHFTIIVCDTLCMRNFILHPDSDAYIADNLKRIIKLHKKQTF